MAARSLGVGAFSRSVSGCCGRNSPIRAKACGYCGGSERAMEASSTSVKTCFQSASSYRRSELDGMAQQLVVIEHAPNRLTKPEPSGRFVQGVRRECRRRRPARPCAGAASSQLRALRQCTRQRELKLTIANHHRHATATATSRHRQHRLEQDDHHRHHTERTDSPDRRTRIHGTARRPVRTRNSI